jgi:GrpB-like predicted nucleotidyltransferase (UPF0157 family)
MIGLKRGIVQLTPYSPEWTEAYQAEKECIAASLGSSILDIQHVGSTAIPGCWAKPIIDVAIIIENIGKVDACILPLQQIGYDYKGENGIPDRHYFVKRIGGDIHTFHIHMCTPDNQNLQNQIIFRDYLLTHPDKVQAYSQLKLELAERFPTDREGYTESKSSFIENVINVAKQQKT